MQVAQVWYLFGELRSYMPRGKAKKKKKVHYEDTKEVKSIDYILETYRLFWESSIHW